MLVTLVIPLLKLTLRKSVLPVRIQEEGAPMKKLQGDEKQKDLKLEDQKQLFSITAQRQLWRLGDTTRSVDRQRPQDQSRTKGQRWSEVVDSSALFWGQWEMFLE